MTAYCPSNDGVPAIGLAAVRYFWRFDDLRCPRDACPGDLVFLVARSTTERRYNRGVDVGLRARVEGKYCCTRCLASGEFEMGDLHGPRLASADTVPHVVALLTEMQAVLEAGLQGIDTAGLEQPLPPTRMQAIELDF